MAKATKTRRRNTSPDPVTAYAESVLERRTTAGPHVRAAARRHIADMRRTDGVVLDRDAVERVDGYYRDVLTVEVEERGEDGSIDSRAVPFILGPWQVFIVGSIFGWRRPDGLRRFRRSYTEIGKGNGKSPMAAGVGHYMLTSTGKLRAEVYAAAAQKDQAMVMFRDAVAMYERSPALRKRLTPSGVNPVWQLTDIARSGFFKPISSENKGKSGIRPYCSLVDEVHEHPNQDVIEMLRAGTKGNQEALMFEITNSGFDRKSVCWSEHEYTVKVLNGEIENDAWFGYIASLDEDDDPFAGESCWIKANPNLGVSIQPPFIREQVDEARGMPSKESIVRRLHFCQWMESDAAAFSRPVLEKVIGDVDADELSEKGYPCFGGLDLSRAKDLTAFTLLWLLVSEPDRWVFASKTWFWTPKDTLAARAKKDRAPYDIWVKDGHMEAVPGVRIGYGWLADALLHLSARYSPVSIAADEYGLIQLNDQLTERGASLPCVVHPQGFQRREVADIDGAPAGADKVFLWMPDSINKLEAAIIEGRITIAKSPPMIAGLNGVVYERNRTDHRMFAKDKATTRIDGPVSLAMAIGVATLQGAETKGGTMDDYLASLMGSGP